MLQIQHLTIRHKKDLRVLLEDFALTLNPGDKAALIGEEGNGKSTLLQWLAAPECIAPYAEAEGQRVLTGERVGYLPQSLPQDQAQQTIYEFFCQEPMFWDYSPKELARQAAQLGLDPAIYYETRLLGSLSGGEKIKAQLLRLLLAQPTLLLLDEPSNDLDGETLRWLEEFLCRWEGTLLFVSHDETLLERVANKIIHLEQLRRKTSCQATTLAMGYGDYCAWREAQHERQGRIARSEQRAAAQQEEKLRRIQQKVEHQLGSISRQDPHGGYLLKKKMRAVKALEHRYEREQARRTSMPEREEAIQLFFRDVPPLPAGKLVLELELPRLMTPDGSRLLAQDIRLRVQGPRKIGLTGRNGAGKSTLLACIRQALEQRPGIRAAYLPQDSSELLPAEKTPVEFLAPSGRKEETEAARTLLGCLKFTPEEMEHPVLRLSGGQRSKLLLLWLTYSGANVLLLDEPTRSLSPLTGPVVREMLAAFPGAILSVSHDRLYLAQVCTDVYRLESQGLRLLPPEQQQSRTPAGSGVKIRPFSVRGFVLSWT